MPSRSLISLIIVFWLGMMSWVVYKEVWPHWQADSPPPFTIDLTDEAQPNGPHHVRWRILINAQEDVYHLETWVRYLSAQDNFELNSEIWPRLFADGKTKESATFGMKSKVVVTREGEMRSFEIKVTPPLPPQNDETRFELLGEVRGNELVPRFRIPDRDFDKTLAPIPLRQNGSVLNPLQPLNRLPNLNPGQKWRMPLVDPIGQALASFLSGSSDYVRYLEAQVLANTENLTWKGESVPCLIVEYQGDEAWARTWVRQQDGLVLMQEAKIDGNSLKIIRDP